jgi:drug/metabolite transporter (DMT)-like permease
MTAVALALLSSISWGTGDFLGGLVSRRINVAAVMLISQGMALAPLLAWALLSGDAATAQGLGLGALAGLAGVFALTAFYRALSIGTMSIVAPISSSGAVVPVAAGLIGGDRPSSLQTLGIAAAIAGVIAASREAPHEDADRAADARQSVLLALVAAVGFGTFLWLMDPASKDGVPWALLAARTASTSAVALAVLVRGIDLRPALASRTLALILLVGALDVGANALYATALGHGLLSVVSVLGSLYPVMTVVLARLVLGERVRRVQEAGVVSVLAGVALIAAG